MSITQRSICANKSSLFFQLCIFILRANLPQYQYHYLHLWNAGIVSWQFERKPEKTLVKIEINGLYDRRWKRDVNVMEVVFVVVLFWCWSHVQSRGWKEKGENEGGGCRLRAGSVYRLLKRETEKMFLCYLERAFLHICTCCNLFQLLYVTIPEKKKIE